MERFNVAIVGGGPGCLAIMNMIPTDILRQIRLILIGVADINPEAPGVKRAQALKIYTTTDYRDLFSLKDLNLILELTGREDVSKSIQREKPGQVQFMDHSVARVFWDMMRLEEAKLTAEREAEQQIKAERDYTATILNNLTDAVLVLNRDYIIENANETFLKEFGLGHETVIGKPCFEIIFNRREPCEDPICPLIDSTLETLRTSRKEYVFQRNGDSIYYEAIFSPLKSDQGNYVSCLLSMRNITHHKRLELDLEKSQNKYWKLFQEARDGILFFNKQGEILESNFSLQRMLGYSRKELEHMKVSELAENTSKKILRDHLQDLEIIVYLSVELEFSKKNGDSLPVEAGISWLPEEELFEAMVRDISIRKRLEESHKLHWERLEKEVEKRTQQLRASQQETLGQKKYAEGIIYGSPIPMFVLDKNHKITYWNKACENLTGYSNEKMIGTDQHWKPFYAHKMPILADLIIESDFATLHRVYDDMNLRKSKMVEGAFEAEHYFPHLGESGIHLYFNAAPIKDDLGDIQGAIVTYQDVSERVRMIQEIRRRGAFAQNLIQNSIDGIIATDSEGKIVIFNQGAVDILGYSPDEIIGKMSYPEILSTDTVKKIRGAFYGDQFGPEGKIINMEVEVLNREGDSIPVRFSGTLLYEKRQEVGSVVFTQDLREIHRLQKEKAQAERMAAIGQTVAGLAHYIKNILNGLKGGAYVINSAMRKNNIALLGDGWSMVEKNIDQITNIVMDMLVYSKERKPQYEMIDPNELVEDVIGLMKERAEASGVSVVQELMPRLEKVSMERTGIHRCLLNLVSNAIDAYTLEGIAEGKGIV